jgi:hypothetical protein
MAVRVRVAESAPVLDSRHHHRHPPGGGLALDCPNRWRPLYQAGVFRELYCRQDRSEAVLVLECADVKEADRVLGTLPLVREGLITFEVIPLIPYPGFSRLFADS